jgi:hypothetical protein
LIASTTFGQFTTNASRSSWENGGEVKFVFALSAAGGTYDSLRSNTFSLDDFDGGTYLYVYHDINGTSCDSIVAQLYGSEDNSTFTILGTAGAAGTSGTILDTVTTLTPTWLSTTLGELRAKYYRLDIEDLGQNAATSSTIIIRGIKRDY